MRHILVRLLFLVALAAPLAAQSDAQELPRTIRGTVRDEETGAPVGGATIRLIRRGFDGERGATPYGAISREDGTFLLTVPALPAAAPAGALELDISSVGYDARVVVLDGADDTLRIGLYAREVAQDEVQVIAVRRTRSVEDACCRVESIHEEVQQHAPFSPSAGDVLRRYSSCTSTRVSCAIDNSSSIRLRGLEPTYVRVLVDGLPAFSGLSTFYGLSMIPAHALQTIRISEGASSGRYGNGAISGVVNLETRPPTEVPEFSISGNLSGDGSELPSGRDLNAGYTGMIGEMGVAAFGSFNSHGAHGEDLLGSYRRGSGLLKTNIMLDDATELTTSALGGWESRHGELPPDSTRYSERVDLRRIDLSAGIAHSFSSDAELTASALFSTFGIDGRYGASTIEGTQRTGYLTAAYSDRFGEHSLLLGGEIRDDRLAERSDAGIGYAITIPSLYLQDELPLGERWTVLGSVRLDHHSLAGTIISPRGSIKYEPVANMPMRLMIGQGFKGEALFDEDHLVLHRIYRWRPNPDFGFERSLTVNYDMSYRFMIGEQTGIDANINAYYTTIDGKGVPQADSLARGVLFSVNSDKPARLTGLELQLRPTFGEHWSGSLALALISYTMPDADGIYRQVPLAPRANLDMSLMYHDDAAGMTLEGWGSYIGSQRLPANPFGLSASKGYLLANLRAEKQVGPIWIFAGVTNLLDARQDEMMPLLFSVGEASYNGGVIWGDREGREIFLGARYSWSGSVE